VVMNTPDHHTLARAVEDARRILQQHIESASLDPTATVEQLLVILDRADVLHALGRVKGCRAMPLVDVRTNRPASVAHLPAPSIVTALNEPDGGIHTSEPSG
jgi:hypothetical protein